MATSAGIVAATAATVGLNELRTVLTSGKPTAALAIKPVVAAFVIGIGLYGINLINAQLASTFCVLVVAGAVLINGKPVFDALGKKVSS